MKPEELLKEAVVLASYVRRKMMAGMASRTSTEVIDAVHNVEHFADEVFNNIQDEARGGNA